MSYCRFSCNDWRSDVYAYEDFTGGWTTHVAGRRIKSDVELPQLPPWLSPDKADNDTEVQKWAEEYFHIFKLQHEKLREEGIFELIGLPYDGQTFNDATIEEFRDRLLELRAIGYQVPQHAIDSVNEEIAEAQKSATP